MTLSHLYISRHELDPVTPFYRRRGWAVTPDPSPHLLQNALTMRSRTVILWDPHNRLTVEGLLVFLDNGRELVVCETADQVFDAQMKL